MFFFFGVVITMFAAITGMIYMNLFSENFTKSYRTQLKGQVERISDQMSELVRTNDKEGSFTYMEYLETIEDHQTTDVWFIAVEEDGEPMAKEFTNANIEDLDLSDKVEYVIERAKNGKVAYKAGYDKIYEKTMICVGAPIYNVRGKIVGIVLLNSAVEERDQVIYSSRRYIVYSIFAGIMISLILAAISAKIITRPITKMEKVALELSKGNYKKRTHIRTSNEIGILAESMDNLAEKLEKNEEERKVNEQMRLDFFANVSHELRTPITVVRGYAETLADGVVTKEEKKQQFYERMVAECKSMERLVGDLLTLSKVQNPHFEIEKEPVNLIQIFQDVLRMYKSILEKKNIHVTLNTEQECIMMMGDYDRLRQLFINILDNAVKFSHEGGNIEIRIKQTEKISIWISDEGIGIEPEEVPHIFEKFYKSKLRQNAKGSGLGLVIAKHIVEKHQGSISVNSKVGKGTVFTIEFEKVKGNLAEIILEMEKKL